MTNLLSYAIIIDMMKREYEIISHAETNFKVFVVNLLYRAPHIHLSLIHISEPTRRS